VAGRYVAGRFVEGRFVGVPKKSVHFCQFLRKIGSFFCL
jgi:hypothetical protein